tara:strand:+ start:3593 stop:4705 length:1113 start_codon:yes stop_codon:yes gene_type:complete
MILSARRVRPALAAALLGAMLFAPAAFAQDEAKTYPSPGEIVGQAQPSEWVTIAPEDLLVMDLAPGRDGKPRRVVIQLMPPPFSQGWIGNIRKLAEAHWWDGTSVNRVQDNYVVQWGDATEKKPLPDSLETVPESEYVAQRLFIPEIANQHDLAWQSLAYFFLRNALNAADLELPNPPDFEQKIESGDTASLSEPTLPDFPDPYAAISGHLLGWPIASDATGTEDGTVSSYWPVHCYGMVGVGRNLSPDTGTGAELYTVIGQAPRHLDRNIALVGRVIEGMENFSSLPRGTGDLGFYKTSEERTPIVSVRLASELPEAQRPNFQYLSTESATFERYADARANRRDPFFNVPAGGADICNIPVPIRATPAQ